MKLLSFLTKQQAPEGTFMSLQEAVRKGLVTFELVGTGEGVTSSVKVEITKLTDDPLTIFIPRGTEFVPYTRQTGGWNR